MDGAYNAKKTNKSPTVTHKLVNRSSQHTYHAAAHPTGNPRQHHHHYTNKCSYGHP